MPADQLLTAVNALERDKRRGKPSRRQQAEDAQAPVLQHLRRMRSDLNFHESALFWYFGERPEVRYASTVQAFGGGASGVPPPQTDDVPRLGCAFCRDQTGEDDETNLVYIEVRAVDGTYWHAFGAHVWCLPDEIAARAPRKPPRPDGA